MRFRSTTRAPQNLLHLEDTDLDEAIRSLWVDNIQVTTSEEVVRLHDLKMKVTARATMMAVQTFKKPSEPAREKLQELEDELQQAKLMRRSWQE